MGSSGSTETTVPPVSIALAFPRASSRLRLLCLAASLALAVGLFAPIITLEKFLLIENTFSVMSGVWQLLLNGQYFLFLLLGIFSVVLPILKLAVLFRLLSRRLRGTAPVRRYLRWMHDYGKWSMLDVFVVAVLVVAVKLGVLVQVELRFGLYAFAAAVLLTMFITARVVGLTDRLLTDADATSGS
jgi:paraquat-inducible protein A